MFIPDLQILMYLNPAHIFHIEGSKADRSQTKICLEYSWSKGWIQPAKQAFIRALSGPATQLQAKSIPSVTQESCQRCWERKLNLSWVDRFYYQVSAAQIQSFLSGQLCLGSNTAL